MRDVGGTLACVENLFTASPLVLAWFPLQFVVFVVFVFFVFVVFVQLWSCLCFPPQVVITNVYFIQGLGFVVAHFVVLHSTLENYFLWLDIKLWMNFVCAFCRVKPL